MKKRKNVSITIKIAMMDAAHVQNVTLKNVQLQLIE